MNVSGSKCVKTCIFMPSKPKNKNVNGKSAKPGKKEKRKATSPLLNESGHCEIGGNSSAPSDTSTQVNKRKTVRYSNTYASPVSTMTNINNMSGMNGMTSPMNVSNMATPQNFQQPNFQQPYSGYGYPQTPQMSQGLPPHHQFHRHLRIWHLK